MDTSTQCSRNQCNCVTLFALLALMTLLAGCGDRQTSVRGKVTFQQKPVEGGIYFFPEKGQPIIVALDAGGQYSAQLPAGTYRVIVNEKVSPPATWKEGDAPPKVAAPLPPKYSEPAVTVLTATVAENQVEPIDFDLK